MTFRPEPHAMLVHDPTHKSWLYFRNPLAVLVASKTSDVLAILEEIDQQVTQRGRFAAGFVAYEAAPTFDPAFQVHTLASLPIPLAWFGIFDQPAWLPEGVVTASQALPRVIWQADIAENEYHAAIHTIKNAIADGFTYQVNYTYRLRAPWQCDAFAFFKGLTSGRPGLYSVFLESETFAVCSFSPELFFSLDGETITGRPMKGTARRGRLLEDDQEQADWLYHSEKNRAENVMIVDMVRNDLGRIAHTGSVRVPRLFDIEKYPTLWQMTSTVEAETQAPLPQIFKALFPCASITGAPKIRTMGIIASLERSPRGIYTGALGFYAPGRQAQFNVAIRTVWIDKLSQQAEYGVGGGIVWDSQADEEWEETQTKARLLHESPQSFDLLETLRWSPGEGWFLLERHLERLQHSAAYFDFSLDVAAVCEALTRLASTFPAELQRVRLTVSAAGKISVEHRPLANTGDLSNVPLARTPVQSEDRFLYHKTTRREVYQAALAERQGYPDVLLWNERGELTESTIANLVVELEGHCYTPPVSSGLLPGTYRAQLLAQGQVEERVIPREDLRRCRRVFLCNSVRGLWQIEVVS